MNISIAMCTYNGEKYLKEQLNSIESQTISPYEIVIVDDSSRDRTREILEDYKKTSKINVRLFFNEKNLGVVKAFEKAISLCEGEYVALSDQDDVWLPFKLETFLKKMRESENKYGKNTPLIIYSDAKVMDEKLNLIAESSLDYQSIYQVEGSPTNLLIIQNLVPGCASLFNKSLKFLALPFGKNAYFHDWWLALVASYFGKIVPIKTQTLLYRQHSKNQVGANTLIPYKKLYKIFQIKRPNSNLTKLTLQAWDMLNLSPDDPISHSLKKDLEILKKGGIRGAILAINKGFLPQKLIRKLRHLYLIILRPLLKT